LPVGGELVGPAIVEQADTTVVLYPGQRGKLDHAGNLIITLSERTFSTAMGRVREEE
jgi:N-methylhydantoinase A